VLLAVPNFSEGRDDETIDAIGRALARGGGAEAVAGRVHLLATHRDPDHNRCVFTLAGDPGALAPALLAGARVAVERIDLRRHEGVHPHVGALDVAPLVHLVDEDRGAACAEALVTADLLARHLALPVLLYGALARGRTRAQLRRGGPAELARRLAARADDGGDDDALRPDFGPPCAHPSAGATLVAARPPLVAFNVTLRPPATLAHARAIAARIREGGSEGLPGLRAIGLELERQQEVQVSMNVERPHETPLCDVVAAIARHAPVATAELVGLAPEAAFEGFPADLPIPNFDPDAHLIERALARQPG
jgi:glutamate formiminotransferase/glutamate formiminotransferase/formiminotetrahydrofolate cyclodeaminase